MKRFVTLSKISENSEQQLPVVYFEYTKIAAKVSSGHLLVFDT